MSNKLSGFIQLGGKISIQGGENEIQTVGASRMDWNRRL